MRFLENVAKNRFTGSLDFGYFHSLVTLGYAIMGTLRSKKINIDLLVLIVSIVALSSAVAIWSDLFLFSKSVRLPEWTNILPSPINVPLYIAFVCLIPVALVPNTLKKATVAITKTILLSPIFALFLYAADTKHQDSYLVPNLLFDYFWVVGFNCLLPAFLLLFLRGCWQVFKSNNI